MNDDRGYVCFMKHMGHKCKEEPDNTNSFYCPSANNGQNCINLSLRIRVEGSGVLDLRGTGLEYKSR